MVTAYEKKSKMYDTSSDVSDSRKYKKPVSGKTAKEKAKDVPSWAKGHAPYVNENGSEFAKRLMDEKYGPGNYSTGPNSEYSEIKKWGDRGFE